MLKFLSEMEFMRDGRRALHFLLVKFHSNILYITEGNIEVKTVFLYPIDYPYASESEVRICALVPNAKKTHIY